jgi:hypothetical protein
MKGIVVAFLFLALVGCATTAPLITKDSPNYIEKGTVSSELKGKSFYVAVGQVDLYRYDLFGYLNPVGKAVESAAAIQADKETGEAKRLVTLQPVGPGIWEDAAVGWRNSVTVIGDRSYGVGDLVGGISVTDLQPYPTWLDALAALKKAIRQLDPFAGTQLIVTAERFYPTVIVPPPVFFPRHPWWWWRRSYPPRRFP